jgi:hypothetical protein
LHKAERKKECGQGVEANRGDRNTLLVGDRARKGVPEIQKAIPRHVNNIREISHGGTVSMVARLKCAAKLGELRMGLPGPFSVPGVRGLGT